MPSEICWIRLARPKPCCGPIVSRVRRTIRSKVPCKISGLRSPLDIQEEYIALPLECQKVMPRQLEIGHKAVVVYVGGSDCGCRTPKLQCAPPSPYPTPPPSPDSPVPAPICPPAHPS